MNIPFSPPSSEQSFDDDDDDWNSSELCTVSLRNIVNRLDKQSTVYFTMCVRMWESTYSHSLNIFAFDQVESKILLVRDSKSRLMTRTLKSLKWECYRKVSVFIKISRIRCMNVSDMILFRREKRKSLEREEKNGFLLIIYELTHPRGELWGGDFWFLLFGSNCND